MALLPPGIVRVARLNGGSAVAPAMPSGNDGQRRGLDETRAPRRSRPPVT